MEETIGAFRCLLLVTPTTKVTEDPLLLCNIRQLEDKRMVIGLPSVRAAAHWIIPIKRTNEQIDIITEDAPTATEFLDVEHDILFL